MLPKFWLEQELYNFDKIVDEWFSFLDWVLPATYLTGLPVTGPAPMLYDLLDLKVGSLVHANPTFFKAFIEAATRSARFEILK